MYGRRRFFYKMGANNEVTDESFAIHVHISLSILHLPLTFESCWYFNPSFCLFGDMMNVTGRVPYSRLNIVKLKSWSCPSYLVFSLPVFPYFLVTNKREFLVSSFDMRPSYAICWIFATIAPSAHKLSLLLETQARSTAQVSFLGG